MTAGAFVTTQSGTAGAYTGAGTTLTIPSCTTTLVCATTAYVTGVSCSSSGAVSGGGCPTSGTYTTAIFLLQDGTHVILPYAQAAGATVPAGSTATSGAGTTLATVMTSNTA
jgi:hypothetical protein